MSFLLTKRAQLCLFYPLIWFLSSNTFANADWTTWFNQQIEQNPTILAAQEKLNRRYSLAQGRGKPLYNPELETELEREGSDNNFRVGMSQTVDWWDKQSLRTAEAEQSRQLAKQQFILVHQQKTYQALQALVEWQIIKQQADLALTQKIQLNRLVELVKQRQEAGDLSLLDAELTILGLSEKLSATAAIEVALKQAENSVLEILPAWSPQSQWNKIPSFFWQSKINPSLNQHPVLMAAKADWKGLQKSALLIQRESKADPTFGVNAGRSGGDNVLALSFSIPLNVRNNFSNEIKAAQQQVLVAEATYQALYRKQKFAILASEKTLMIYQQRLKRWQNLMQGRSERFSQLLEKQWQSGDFSTSEYLLALQQRTEALNAGIELQKQTQLAYLNWLYQNGQIEMGIQ